MEEVIPHSSVDCFDIFHCLYSTKSYLADMKIIIAILKDTLKDVLSWNWIALVTWGIILFIAVKLFKFLLGLIV